MFISYQWGKQKQISVLYRRLTELGYSCWMDIKQMGGGDSLYDKIDRGVRGSKLVISCVTKKYALSANCRREVSLSDALKRPIIPLLLEDLIWPPEGPMGMVFTQLKYIEFIKPDPNIQNEWNCPQFDEFLGKIKGHIPDKNAPIDRPKSIHDQILDEIEEQNKSEDDKVENNELIQDHKIPVVKNKQDDNHNKKQEKQQNEGEHQKKVEDIKRVKKPETKKEPETTNNELKPSPKPAKSSTCNIL